MSTSPRAFAPLDLLQIVAVAAIWGANNVAAKIALLWLPPFLTVAMRFLLVLVALAPWIRLPPQRGLPLLIAMLLCVGPLHFAIQYFGLHLARELAPMVVAMQLWAPASVVFAAMLLGERVGALRWLGVGLAFAGAASMNFDPSVFAQIAPLALVASAACLYGLGAVLVRKIGAASNPWVMQTWIALLAAPTMLIASAAFEGGQVEAVLRAPWYVWACVMFGGIVSSVVANAFMFRLVQRYEVSRTTPYLLLSPVLSFFLAAVVLGDHITWRIVAGAMATLAGVALVALAEGRFRTVATADAHAA
ncbi:MAG: DMT family transporter [Proteobacteria bacterium]|nr:DMT family transporter [Pseudomonadota bacterium]